MENPPTPIPKPINSNNPKKKAENSLFDLFNVKKEDLKKMESIRFIKEEEEEVEENYLKINTKNQFEIYDSEESYKKLNEMINYANELIKEKSTTENIANIFLDKLFPKCQHSIFLICKLISKRFIKSKKINSKEIEKKIQFFFDRRITLRYSKKLLLDKETINNIGYILCYSYSKFDDFKIYNKIDLNKCIKTDKKRDVINDFYACCNETGKSPLDFNLFNYIDNNSNKYFLPAELLFLINILDFINFLEIDMDIKIDNNNKEEHDDDFYLFIMTYLNICHLVNSTDHIKVNFNNIQLQKDLYMYFTEELESLYKTNKKYYKKNKEIPDIQKYKRSWDFEKDYIIPNTNKLSSNKGEENLLNDDNNDDIDILDLFNEKKKIENLRKSDMKMRNELSFMKLNIQNIRTSLPVRAQTTFFPDLDNLINFESISKNFTFIERNDKKKPLSKYDVIVDKNKNILELIFIVILGVIHLNKLETLDLIMNDCYYKEFINSFGQNYSSSSTFQTSINSFHILNSFMKKLTNIHILNIEFNSLDYITFYKFLSILKSNTEINSLQISFFPSLIAYTPQYLLKIYQQNSDKNDIDFSIHTPGDFILNDFLGFFMENLEVLFELIRRKSDKLIILSFNFDIPEIISNKQRYLNVILKFILNILFLIDNKNSKIQKLVIISPKTMIDSHSILGIENMINSINIEKKNKKMKELSMQLQFYNIKNISNLLSTNLINIKIGEVDIVTLRGLTKYLCSFKFFTKSSLKSLTIGILNHITNFSKEIEYLLNELFGIKIKTLKEINIYSNIIIKDKKNFYKIFENNWISSCLLTLNEKSQLSWKQKEIEEKIDQIVARDNKKDNKKNKEKNKEKKVYYLIHHEIEEEVLHHDEKVQRTKKKYTKTNCEVAWILRYFLIFKFAKKNQYKINYYEQKNIIFNILKFLYFTKTAKIEYTIKNS
jgi:hypothetical protein